jgi:hypothetical protein
MRLIRKPPWLFLGFLAVVAFVPYHSRAQQGDAIARGEVRSGGGGGGGGRWRREGVGARAAVQSLLGVVGSVRDVMDILSANSSKPSASSRVRTSNLMLCHGLLLLEPHRLNHKGPLRCVLEQALQMLGNTGTTAPRWALLVALGEEFERASWLDPDEREERMSRASCLYSRAASIFPTGIYPTHPCHSTHLTSLSPHSKHSPHSMHLYMHTYLDETFTVVFILFDWRFPPAFVREPV